MNKLSILFFCLLPITALSSEGVEPKEFSDFKLESEARKTKTQSSVSNDGLNPEQKAAANNGNAAKYELDVLAVNVNERTGAAIINSTFPSISALSQFSPSLSYSSYFDLSYYNASNSVLGLPSGWYYKDIPFMLKKEGDYVLYLDGSGYYVDNQYRSIKNNGDYYQSGLRYQASESFHFKRELGTLTVIDRDGGKKTLSYSWRLDYQNGTSYYFSEGGLLVGVSDKYFADNTADNIFHITRFTYSHDVKQFGPLSNKLVGIEDGITKLEVNYLSAGVGITLSYGENSSSQGYYVRIVKSGLNKIQKIVKSLGHDQRDTPTYSQVNFSYQSSENPNLLTQLQYATTYDKTGSEYGFVYKNIAVGYDERQPNVMPKVTRLITSDGSFNHKGEVNYSYFGSENAGYQFGRDTMMSIPDGDAKRVYYSTIMRNGDLQVWHQYNYLHNEIKTDYRACTTLTTDCRYISSIEMAYPKPIKKDNNALLSTYYTKPIKTTGYTYNQAGEKVYQSLAENVYDDYGNVTEVKTYLPQKVDDAKAPQLISQVKTTYDNRYLVKLEESYTDYLSLLTSKSTHQLDKAGKNIIETKTAYKDAKTDQWQLEKVMAYTYSTAGNWCQSTAVPSKDLLPVVGLLCRTEVKDVLSDETMKNETVYVYQSGLDNRHYGTLIHYDIDALSHIWESRYDAFDNRQLTATDPLGYTTKMRYDVSARPLSVTEPSGLTSTTLYDDKAKVVIERSPNGYGVKATYDHQQNVIQSEVNSTDKETWVIAETKDYDYRYNKLSKTTDQFGNYSEYHYDVFGRLASIKDNFNNETVLSYDAACDERFGCYEINRSELNNKENKGTAFVSYIRSDDTLYTQSKTAGIIDRQQSNRYDASNHILESIVYDVNEGKAPDQVKSKRQYHYLANGLLDSIELSTADHLDYKMTYRYDTLLDEVIQRELTSKDFKRQTPEKRYSKTGQLLENCYVDPASNGQNNLVCQSYRYDANGRLKVFKDFNGNEMQHDYDPKSGYLLSRVIKEANGHQANEIKYVYDLKTGEIVRLSDQSGYQIESDYDFAGRITALRYQAPHWSKAYKVLQKYNDETGQLEQARIGSNNFSYAYDTTGRLIKMASAVGDSIDYHYYDYDASKPLDNRKMKAITYNLSGVANPYVKDYVYDSRGLVETLSYHTGDKSLFTVTNHYRNDGNVTKKVYASKARLDANLNNQTLYEYDDLNRLIKSQLSYSGGHYQTATYRYDAVGNLLEKTQVGENKNTDVLYQYDNLNRLLSKAEGNEKTHYYYDLNGNLLKSESNQGSTVYGYNAENQLVSYQGQGHQALYDYYPNGLRAVKSVDGGKSIGFLYNSEGSLVSELQGYNQTSYLSASVRYIKGLSSNPSKQLLITSGKDTPYMIDVLKNQHESIYLGDYGKLGDLNQAGEGRQVVVGDIHDNPFKYGPSYYDGESDHYYMKSRYYDPNIERFIARDNTDLMNLYSYANGNPIMNIDPSGQSAVGTSTLSHHSSVGVFDLFAGIGQIIAGVGTTIAGVVTAQPELFVLSGSLYTGGVGSTVSAFADNSKGLHVAGEVLTYAAAAVDVGYAGYKIAGKGGAAAARNLSESSSGSFSNSGSRMSSSFASEEANSQRKIVFSKLRPKKEIKKEMKRFKSQEVKEKKRIAKIAKNGLIKRTKAEKREILAKRREFDEDRYKGVLKAQEEFEKEKFETSVKRMTSRYESDAMINKLSPELRSSIVSESSERGSFDVFRMDIDPNKGLQDYTEEELKAFMGN